VRWAARRRSRSRRSIAKGDAEEVGALFRYPADLLFFSTWRPQQRAIAAAHQGETGLDQTNGSIAQIMGFPRAFGYLSGAKQDFRDFAVRPVVHARIEGAKRKCQTTAALRRNCMQRRSGRTVVQGSPQPTRCVRTELEVAVERKFDRIGFGNDWWFLQPNTMLESAQMQHGVPAVGRLPQFAGSQFVEFEVDASVWTRSHRRTKRDHRRQHLRRPEYDLFEEGLVGVSCENTGPICDGSRHSRWKTFECRDGPVDSSDCDAGIPRPIR
jgi:hypothetical protein